MFFVFYALGVRVYEFLCMGSTQHSEYYQCHSKIYRHLLAVHHVLETIVLASNELYTFSGLPQAISF